MSFLDMRTVMFMLLVTTCIGALLVLPLWLRNRRHYKGLHLLAFDFVLQASAMGLIILRGAIPESFSIVSGNVLIITGAILGYIGLEQFLDKKGPQIQNMLLLTVFFFLEIYFTFVQPVTSARLLISAAALLIVCLECVWLLFYRTGASMRPITRDVGMVFLGFSVISIARIFVLFIFTDTGRSYFQSGMFQTVILVLYSILFTLFTYTLSLMINKRLLYEIQSGEEKFSKAFHSSPYALSLTRLSDGKFLNFNECFLRMFGYTSDDIAGKTSLELSIWYDSQDRKTISDDLRKHGSIKERELLLQHKSGNIICGLAWCDLLVVDHEACVLSSIIDITDRKQQQFERESLIEKLQQAIADVQTLSGLLPICSSCKKIRDDKGYWNSLEAYLHKHSPARFSHSICPDCRKKLYPEYAENKKK